MSLFRPRPPRPFQHEYRYARPKRLIGESRSDKEPSHRAMPLMGILMMIILLAILFIVWQLLSGK